MKQFSIFDLQQSKRRKTSAEVIDLTIEELETLNEFSSTVKVESSLTQEIDDPFSGGPEVAADEFIRSDNLNLESLLDDINVKEELSSQLPELTPENDGEVVLDGEAFYDSKELEYAYIDRPESLSEEEGIWRFYDSDSDEDPFDSDYEYIHENDIDLDYSTEEEVHGFKIVGQIPLPKSKNTPVNIDSIVDLELVESISICPVCRVDLGSLQKRQFNSHLTACRKGLLLERTPKRLPRTPKLEKPPTLRNSNSRISPSKAISPPKSLNLKSRRRPIPEVKKLTFPINPVQNYTVSMDAFNYAPDADIEIYFLSHFHSDHYGGISKKWSYERIFDCVDDFKDMSKYRRIIYCTDITAKLLTVKFGIDPRFIQVLALNKRYLVRSYDSLHIINEPVKEDTEITKNGLYVTLMSANHCPGAAIFLFESKGEDVPNKKYLHCGDFRVNKEMIDHQALLKFKLPGSKDKIDKVYLDTTYMSLRYNFPKNEKVCEETAQMFHDLTRDDSENILGQYFGHGEAQAKQSRITDFLQGKLGSRKRKKFLILVGTYVIGKEKLAIAILEKLGTCPIFVLSVNSRNGQQDVVKAFSQNYLDKYVTNSETGDSGSTSVIHLVPMQIIYSIETMSSYFYENEYFNHFERCIGLRPTGWLYSGNYAFTEKMTKLEYTNPYDGITKSDSLNDVIDYICNMCDNEPQFSYKKDVLDPEHQRKTKTTRNPEKDVLRIYTLPYSEHSSFRELSYFSLFLNSREIIPTVVNILDIEKSELKMKNLIAYWKKMRAARASKEVDPDFDRTVYHKLKLLNLSKF